MCIGYNVKSLCSASKSVVFFEKRGLMPAVSACGTTVVLREVFCAVRPLQSNFGEGDLIPAFVLFCFVLCCVVLLCFVSFFQFSGCLLCL